MIKEVFLEGELFAFLAVFYMIHAFSLPSFRGDKYLNIDHAVGAAFCIFYECIAYFLRKRLPKFLAVGLRVVFVLIVLVCCAIYGQLNPVYIDYVTPDIKGDKISIVIPTKYEAVYIVPTVMYCLENVSPHVLHEVILVDDASAEPVYDLMDKAKEGSGQLAKFDIETLSKIKVLRNKEKEGLIRSKIIGGNFASGNFIFFLDGHCRIQPNSLELLLQRQAKGNYRTIVCPRVADVNGDTWEMKTNIGSKMIFQWNFNFRWFDDGTDEIPIMSGGLLLISKRWWDETGYDSGMYDWGGENIEQSLNAWSCGGDIVVERESVVGHIFSRPANPNKTGKDVVSRNQARAGMVYLDDYFDVFLSERPQAKRMHGNYGDSIEGRMLNRLSNKCATFETFMNKFVDVFEYRGLVVEKMHNVRDNKTGKCLVAVPKADSTAETQITWDKCSNIKSQRWGLIQGGTILICRDDISKTLKCLARKGTGNDVYGRDCKSKKDKHDDLEIRYGGTSFPVKGRPSLVDDSSGPIIFYGKGNAKKEQLNDQDPRLALLTKSKDNLCLQSGGAKLVKCSDKNAADVSFIW